MSHVTKMPIFKTSECWIAYAERLEFFFKGNDIDDNDKKHALLISSFDASTFQLAKSLVQPNKLEEKSYAELVALLKDHFSPRPSVIVSRYRFNSRIRQPAESVSTYIAELKSLAEYCDYGAYLDEMIRDRLVCGINDERIQRRLLQEPDLTYEGAYRLATAMETATKDARDLQLQPKNGNVEEVKKLERTGNSRPNVQRRNQQVCYRCKGDHLDTNCPFRQAYRHVCGIKGHIAKACRSKLSRARPHRSNAKMQRKATHQVTIKDEGGTQGTSAEDKKDETYTLFSVVGKNQPIVVTVHVNNTPLIMEVDTGAALSLLSKATWKTKFPHLELKPSNISLRTYTGETLKVLGTLEVQVYYNSQNYNLPLLVVEGEGQTLLGRNWLEKIKINWPQIKTMSADTKLNDVIQEFAEVFQERLGCLKEVQAKIYIEEETKPKFFRARPVPYNLKAKVEAELQRLQKLGVISPVTYSDWATPVVPVLKTNGSIRLCGDYKVTINKCVRKDVYPLPKIEDLFAALGGGVIFSKLDLTSAYQQVPLQEESKQYTVINTHKGLFRYERLPFGISTAPSIFQHQMECILQDMDFVCVYLDDILITGTSEQDYHKNLRQVLNRLKMAGLTVQKSKCTFATKSIEYLGHVIDSTGLHPAPSKVEAIHRVPPPSNITELKSFLGLINYYCKFLPRLSTLLFPLYRLLSNNTKWTWSTTEQEAFDTAKQLLTSSSVLVHFDPNKDIILMCDASPFGLGAVLTHRMQDGTDRPIAYASRTLSKVEQKYCHLEKEGLAIVYGVKRFHQFLCGRTFTILSDHQPLKYLFSESRQVPVMASARIQRWALTLAAYDYAIQYRPGTKMGNADALSRAPLPDSPKSVPEPEDLVCLIKQLSETIVTAEQIKKWTQSDPIMASIYRQVQQGWTLDPDSNVQPYYNRKQELSIHHGCILWGNRVIIPPVGRNLVLKLLHETHPGVTRMKRLARSYVWWPGMDRAIEDKVRHCEWCEEHKKTPSKVPIHPWEWPSRPWARVHIDHAGPVAGKLLLIMVDAHSKWIEAHEVQSTSATATIKVLKTVFATHGIPEQLVSDNGSGFASAEFMKFTQEQGIHHTFTAPYHPAANGLAERAVQLVKRAIQSHQGDIMEHLNEFLMRYRIIPHSTTEVSPSELLMGRRIRSNLDCIFPNVGTKVQHKQQQQTLHSHGQRRCHPFNIGDKVYVRNYGRGNTWIQGEVVKVTGPVSYIIKTTDNYLLRRHRSQVKSRETPDRLPELDEDDFPIQLQPTTRETNTQSTMQEAHDSPTQSPMEQAGPLRRSSRPRRPPNRFAPYVSSLTRKEM